MGKAENRNNETSFSQENKPYSEKEIRVPYRERRSIKKHLIPRLERRKQRARLLKLIIAILLGIFIVFTGAYSLKLRSVTSVSKEDKSRIAGKESKAFKTKSIIFLAFSVEEKNQINGASIIGYEKKEKSVKILTLKGDVHLNLMGVGLQKLRLTDTSFAPLTFYSIANSFPFTISFYILVPAEKYENALKDKELGELFGGNAKPILPQGKKMSQNELQAYESDFKKIKKENVEIIACPTKLSKAGNEDILLVDDRELAQASTIFFSDSFKKKKGKAVILVLNGSGVPGAGLKAAMLLVGAGFRVFAIRNAESFDYKVTRIEVYGSNKKKGEEVQKILKFGEIFLKPIKNDVIDVSVIIGADFAHAP